jgi:prolyl oligopeptidase PreP (S9A serine peptidase family)
MDIQKKFERAFEKAEILVKNQGRKRIVFKEVNFSHDGERFILTFSINKEDDKITESWLNFSARNRIQSKIVTLEDINSNLSITEALNIQKMYDILEDRVEQIQEKSVWNSNR